MDNIGTPAEPVVETVDDIITEIAAPLKRLQAVAHARDAEVASHQADLASNKSEWVQFRNAVRKATLQAIKHFWSELCDLVKTIRITIADSKQERKEADGELKTAIAVAQQESARAKRVATNIEGLVK